MISEEYKDKYACKYDVYNYEIFDTYGNLITTINTVQSDTLQVTKEGKYFLRIIDALIDKKFLDYITHNTKFEGSIKGTNVYRDFDSVDHPVNIDMPKVVLSDYVLKNAHREVTTVNFLFELHVSQLHGYAVDYKLDV